MGIKHLNRFLSHHCSSNSISKRSLSEFRNKVLAVDASIYLYRFVESNMLIEGFYNMISIFRKYNITPIFVFDGKPPVEKRELLEKRRCEKDAAEKIYNELKSQLTELSTGTVEEDELKDRKTELINEMDTLKKRFVRLKPSDIHRVKDLLTAYGSLFIEADGEADQLCAYLVHMNYAWACVSDDMDMFLYGCARVIRHISLVNHTGILYDTQIILNELSISYELFRDIMILSGTDYNINQKHSLIDTMKLYTVFMTDVYRDIHFYDWLRERVGYVINTDSLAKIREMFDISLYETQHASILHKIDNLQFYNKPANVDNLRNLLYTDGFIFIAK